jgi:hypothetical protein
MKASLVADIALDLLGLVIRKLQTDRKALMIPVQ